MTNGKQAPEVIMFVRHGEKPGEGTKPHGVNHHGEHDGHSLSVLGWIRAGALAGLFAHAPSRAHPHIVRPGRIIATRPTEEAKSKREIHTAAPTAQRLKLEIEDAHTHGHEADLATEVLARPDSVLVVWHHGTMAKIVRHFPVAQPRRHACALAGRALRPDLGAGTPAGRGPELSLRLRAADAAGRRCAARLRAAAPRHRPGSNFRATSDHRSAAVPQSPESDTPCARQVLAGSVVRIVNSPDGALTVECASASNASRTSTKSMNRFVGMFGILHWRGLEHRARRAARRRSPAPWARPARRRPCPTPSCRRPTRSSAASSRTARCSPSPGGRRA